MESSKASSKSKEIKGATSDDVKVFLKIKKVDYVEERPYFKLSENSKSFTLLDPIRKVPSEKSIEFDDFDKIFTEEENSYIYEHVCRNTIKEALKGEHFCFIGYGLTRTGRKSTLIGKTNSLTNLNSRGIFFRLLENLLKETKDSEISLNISIAAVNKTRYLDLVSNFMGKKFQDYEEKRVLDLFKEIGQNDLMTSLRRLSVSDLNEVIHFYAEVMALFYKLEPMNERLYSRSHFIFFVNLVDNSGKTISNISFCLFAGSEKFTPHPNDKVDKNSHKYKESIYIQSAFENMKTIIVMLKGNEQMTNKELPFDESPLTSCIKSYINPSTKFRVLGCIQPNAGYYESVKDSLMYLYGCKKVVSEKSGLKRMTTMETRREEMLYELESKIKSQEKSIKKLNDNISDLQKKLIDNEANYKKNLDTIKSAFNFEGDITKLLLNEDSVKEARYARSIRDSVDMVRLLKGKIVDFEKKIEEMKEENKKLQFERKVIENDQAMVKLYTKYKEDNLHEENMRKLALDNCKEIEALKKGNEVLTRQIELYKSDIENKNKFIHNLPEILKENVKDKNDKANKKTEMANELEKKYKKNLKDNQISLQNELKITNQAHEGEIKIKNEEIESLKIENANLKTSIQQSIKKYSDELVKVYQNLHTLLDSYKKTFDMRRLGNNVNSLTSFNNFLKAKDDYDKICENISENVMRYNFPLLFSHWDNSKLSLKKSSISEISNFKEKTKPNSEIKNINNNYNIKIKMTNYNKQNLSLSASDISEEEERLNQKKIFVADDLEKYDKGELYAFIQDLQKQMEGFHLYFDKVKKVKRGLLRQQRKEDSRDKELNHLFVENERLKRKLDEQVKINYSNKVSLHSQERLLDKYSSKGFFPNTKNITGNNNLVYKPRPESSVGNQINGFASPRNQSQDYKINSKFRPQTGRY